MCIVPTVLHALDLVQDRYADVCACRMQLLLCAVHITAAVLLTLPHLVSGS
jgi:hypothetical protein